MPRLGSRGNPLLLSVHTPEQAEELVARCDALGWNVVVRIAPDEPMDLQDLEHKLLPDVLEYEGPKLSRNEPCPCGSGKKYKKCCLDHDQAA
jgi:SWIM/SEC-C metal-binding protein